MIRYQLRSNARLDTAANGNWLWSDRPLVGVHLNDSAFQLLRQIQTGEPLVTISLEQQAFLLELVNQGWLELTLPPLSQPYPTVSVVVPVRNRPRGIEICLRSLLALDYPPDHLEIIVVDDASTDETRAVIQGMPVCLVEAKSRQGASACRNQGVEHATGDIIAFTDSDCRVSKTWLQELIPYLSLPGCVAVGGKVLPKAEATLLERYVASYSALDMGARTRLVSPHSSVFYVPTANLLVKREEMQQIGGFDPDFPIGEDIDLEYRLMKHQGQVWYAPCGVVYHDYRTRLWSHWVRQHVYAMSEGYLQERHAELRKQWHLRLSSLFWLIGLAGSLVSQQYGLLLLPVFVFAWQFRTKWQQTQPLKAGIGIGRLLESILRGYWADAFFASWLVLRYYLIFLGLVTFFWPALGLPLVLFLLLAPLGEYEKSRPPLPLLFYVPLYLADGLAYHFGTLKAVVTQGTMWPLRTSVGLKFV